MRNATSKPRLGWLALGAVIAATTVSIAGCVAYPATGYYGGGYYGGSYAYAASPVVIAPVARPYAWGGWGGHEGRWHDGGRGEGWGRGYGHYR